MSTLLQRICAFSVGASLGCASGMVYLHNDMYRSQAAVGVSVKAVEDAKEAVGLPTAASPLEKSDASTVPGRGK